MEVTLHRNGELSCHLPVFPGKLVLSPGNSFTICLLVVELTCVVGFGCFYFVFCFVLSTANPGQPTPDILKNVILAMSMHHNRTVHLINVYFCLACVRTVGRLVS